MKFIITHQKDRIEQLQKSAAHITDLLHDMNVYNHELVDMLNTEKIVNHYRDKMFFYYLMTAGILANELLQEYTIFCSATALPSSQVSITNGLENSCEKIDYTTIWSTPIFKFTSGKHLYLL